MRHRTIHVAKLVQIVQSRYWTIKKENSWGPYISYWAAHVYGVENEMADSS